MTTARGTTFGVRFRIGAAGAALGLPAAELLDLSVPLEDVWGGGAAGRERARARRGGYRQVRRGRPARARGRHRHAAPRARDRRPPAPPPLPDAVGYGPKTLERILRFQRFLMLGGDDLARLALDAGYADQAHLTRECTRLAGLPPRRAAGRGRRGRRREVRFVQDGLARTRHDGRMTRPRRRPDLPPRQRPRPRAPPLRPPASTAARRSPSSTRYAPTATTTAASATRSSPTCARRPASPSASRPSWRSCTRSASTTTR